MGKKASPAKESLDWEPMGSITMAPVTIKKMHDRGAKITMKRFGPTNHVVQSRGAKISYNGI